VKKNIVKTSIIILLLLSVLISSCKKGNDTNIPIKQDLIDFFGFAKSGSYFVYEDSVSGNIDTFKITNYQNTRVDCGFVIDGKEQFESQIIYIYTTTFSHQTIYVTLSADCDLNYMSTIQMSFGAALGQFTLTYSNTKFDSITPLPFSSDSIITSRLPYYSVFNFTYQDVLYLNNLQEYGSYSNSDYWICKNTGIVQIKNQRNNSNWKLINKHILL
jgi:hypothetical protein